MFSRPAYVALEIGVEGLRAVMILAIIGGGDVLAGVRSIWRFLTTPAVRDVGLSHLSGNLGLHWVDALENLAAFAVVGLIANLIIFGIASNSRVLAAVRRAGLAAPDEKARKLALVLFVKNITIIPFSAVWLWGLVLLLAR